MESLVFINHFAVCRHYGTISLAYFIQSVSPTGVQTKRHRQMARDEMRSAKSTKRFRLPVTELLPLLLQEQEQRLLI